jgi:6-phosphogluconolactonase (cycloisomerase 2 family)
MKMQIRAVLVFTLALAMLALSGCDHYNCSSGANFGSSSCTSTGTGLGTGTTGSATAAFVFAVDTAGTIDGYTLNTQAGSFAATSGYTAPTVPTNDGGVGMAVAQSQFLYTGFAATNQIYGWTISSSGDLTAISGSPVSAPFLADVGGGFGTASMITNPAGTLLFLADTFQNQIYVYQIGSGGVLTVPATAFSTGSVSPVNMTTDGLGKYLYATESFSSHTGTEIAAFTIGSTGSLTPVVGSPFAFPMWQVQGEPSGKFLIGTTGQSMGINGADNDQLYVFNIAQSGSNAGALTQVSGTFQTTYSPFSIAVQPSTGGNLVYSFGFNDALAGFNAAEGFSIDSSSGVLTEVSGSPFTNIALGSSAQFDQSGAFLFVYGIVDSSSTFSYPLSPVDVASGGALTEPISSATLATAGQWVVTDPQ